MAVRPLPSALVSFISLIGLRPSTVTKSLSTTEQDAPMSFPFGISSPGDICLGGECRDSIVFLWPSISFLRGAPPARRVGMPPLKFP